MAPFPNPFRKKAESNPARDAIRGWAEAALGNDPPLTLTISEIDCGDPVCPGLETIILVMREGEATQAAKIRKSMEEITELDVRDAVKYI
ncbi:hypothetical protein [Rhabdaerophilum sp.]|uniref:hypothetical protein n=1 Tax=Rhabdaerophilum sp. TaxID=2717341 RepID=UPI0038D4DB97